VEEEEEEKEIEKGKERCQVWGGVGVGEEGKEWAGWALPLRMGKEGKEWAGWALPVPLKALSFSFFCITLILQHSPSRAGSPKPQT